MKSGRIAVLWIEGTRDQADLLCGSERGWESPGWFLEEPRWQREVDVGWVSLRLERAARCRN